MDGTPKGRLGFVNIKGGFQLFVVRDDGQQNLGHLFPDQTEEKKEEGGRGE